MFKYRKNKKIKPVDDITPAINGGSVQPQNVPTSLSEKLSRLSFVKKTQAGTTINPKLKKFVELRI
jgi:hypothetical protein